jgi:hypothetical protein
MIVSGARKYCNATALAASAMRRASSMIFASTNLFSPVRRLYRSFNEPI